MILNQLGQIRDGISRFNSYYVESTLYMDSTDSSVDYYLLNAPNQKSKIVYPNGTEDFYVPSEQEYLILAEIFTENKTSEDKDYDIWQKYLEGDRSFC